MNNISEDAAKIMLASLSQSTLKQYYSSINKWILFCQDNKLEMLNPQECDVINFLTKEFLKGCSYGSINTHRSALSLISKNKIGESLLIKRFLKGCFKLRPTFPKYNHTWDVNIVLDYLEKLESPEKMPLRDLSYKTIMLIALCTAQRAQTIAKIKCENINVNDHRIEIVIRDIIKTSKAGCNQPVLILPKFTERPGVCVYSCLKVYLERTNKIRNNINNLFISLREPPAAISAQTVSRWLKTVMSLAGVNTNLYSGHSTRHASTSAAAKRGVDYDSIRMAAGWSANSEVFARFYKRPIIDKNDNFAKAVLLEQKQQK